MAHTLEQRLRQAAGELGFDSCQITSANLPAQTNTDLRTYIANGNHGTMEWMAETMARRGDPKFLWPQANSVIMLAMNYGPADNPLDLVHERDIGQVSVYARGRDYHEIIKGKLKTLAGKLVSWQTCDVKVFVDTAPVMEKPLAANAGIGWQGKHTNLVSRDFGSWLFLGSIFTTAKLQLDVPEEDHCGNCQSCLDICPTQAFPAPFQLDARRCISYLTIENKGPIPLEFRRAMGNKIFGCDDCLAVCPWNKFASVSREMKLQPRAELQTPALSFLATLEEEEFRRIFSRSPVKRIGRNRFLRNVLIAIGNSGNQAHLPQLENHLLDPDPLVRGASVWALRMLGVSDRVERLQDKHLGNECDETVRIEWSQKLHGEQ